MNQKIYYLWEKEIKNPREVKSTTEAMGKEDLEKLQNRQSILKRRPKIKIKRPEKSITGLFYI